VERGKKKIKGKIKRLKSRCQMSGKTKTAGRKKSGKWKGKD